jgi:hypothetical protein
LEVPGFPLAASIIFVLAWILIIGHILHAFHWFDVKQLIGWKQSAPRSEEVAPRVEERLEIVETDPNDVRPNDVRERNRNAVVIAA